MDRFLAAPRALDTLQYEGRNINVMVRDGEAWWVASEVCEVLEISNSRDAVGRLKDDEKMTVALTDSQAGHGAQSQTLINEPGLYRLIMRSRKKKAEDFQWWIAHKVLPEIRRHGTYGFNPDNNLTIIRQIAEMQLQTAQQLKEMTALLSKKESPAASLPYRARLNEYVRDYARAMQCPHADIWNRLYEQFYYAHGINLKLRASNAGVDTVLDIAERLGYMEQLYKLALRIFLL